MVKHISIIMKAVNKKYKGDPEKIGNWMGKFTAARRFRLTKRWHEDSRCHFCRKELAKPGEACNKSNMPTYDHKIAQQAGGSEAYNNCILSCTSCNNLKGSMSYDKFLNLNNDYVSYKKEQQRLKNERVKEVSLERFKKLSMNILMLSLMCFDKNIKENINELSC